MGPIELFHSIYLKSQTDWISKWLLFSHDSRLLDSRCYNFYIEKSSFVLKLHKVKKIRLDWNSSTRGLFLRRNWILYHIANVPNFNCDNLAGLEHRPAMSGSSKTDLDRSIAVSKLL